MRSEALTRTELIDPALVEAGWAEEVIEREYLYRKGRIWLVDDEPHRDQAQYADYVLRAESRGLPIAVIEAKAESKSPGAGLQQAIAYATDLGARWAFSTNGHAIVEQDLVSQQVRTLDAFPSPAELVSRLSGITAPQEVQVRGRWAQNPLRAASAVYPDGRRMRYYQEQAVRSGLEQLMLGHHRALLAMATGTGKTLIAANLISKLRESGSAEKVLILVDRTSLLSQAYNELAIFGDARGVVVGSEELPLQRDIHFATYQTLFTATATGHRIFERYEPDYFDVVIVDECHRSGYGDWRAILDHFDSAFQLGMTATPKRTDSIDTYRFFAEENSQNGSPTPAYEYSLAAGIEDGFLATYQVHRFSTNVDEGGLHIDSQLALGAELVVPQDAEGDIRDVYETAQFEREIIVPDRTRVMCEHLATLITNWGLNEKTIVFCVTMEHAGLVRQELQNILGPLTGRNRYAVRIVSEERDTQGLLEEFQNSDSVEPTLATTVDLLSTGIDVPSVKNVVFMRTISSPSLFKQIIGRGTRISQGLGKYFFRIVDYTNASRLLDAWDIPAAPQADEEFERIPVEGRVWRTDQGTGIEGATVRGYAGTRLYTSILTGPDGEFTLSEMPVTRGTLMARADGYRRGRVEADIRSGIPPIEIGLDPIEGHGERLSISGVEVTITGDGAIAVHDGNNSMSADQFLERAGEAVRGVASSPIDVLARWSTQDSRNELLEELASAGVRTGLLILLLGRPDADEVDGLLHVGFGADMTSRAQRAERTHARLQCEGGDLPDGLVQDLLDRYCVAGVADLSTAAVFQTEPFAERWGGVRGVAGLLGGADGVRALMMRLQQELYSD